MMNLAHNMLMKFGHYAQELWFVLAVGFLLSGIFYKLVPEGFVGKYLGQRGVRPVFLASVIGCLLPVCCIGSLPIALTLHRKGASLAAVLAFLVATPATSVSALIVSWKLMGGVFTVVIFLAVIVMGLVMGGLCNRFIKDDLKENVQDASSSCCHAESDQSSTCCGGGDASDAAVQSPVTISKDILRYAFYTLPKEMGGEILIGIAIASFISVYPPVQDFIHSYLSGLLGYAVIMIGGLITYVCSTASVPMAEALYQSGMSQGQALCYLLVGPITSYGTILVIKNNFGGRVLVLYLSTICLSSFLFGMIYDVFLT